MTKVAVFVKKRVISLANVPKKAKIVPRGVVSSAERRAIAKPIVPMKLRMAAVIKGAVLRYLFSISYSLHLIFKNIVDYMLELFIQVINVNFV